MRRIEFQIQFRHLSDTSRTFIRYRDKKECRNCKGNFQQNDFEVAKLIFPAMLVTTVVNGPGGLYSIVVNGPGRGKHTPICSALLLVHIKEWYLGELFYLNFYFSTK